MTTSDTATIAALCSAVTGVLAVLCTKGADAYVKWRKTNHEIEAANCHEDDERADNWAKILINRQQQDIESLRAEVRQLVVEINDIRREHMNCEKIQAELRAEVAALRKQVGTA